MNHLDLLPGPETSDHSNTAESLLDIKKDYYLKEAGKLFEQVKTNGTGELIQQATFYEAYSMILLEQPEEALMILGDKTPTFLPVEPLIAAAFRQKNQNSDAETVLQSGIYQYVTILLSLLTNYAALLIDKPKIMKATYQRGMAFCETFDLANLHPVIMLNFLASCLTTFVLQGETDFLVESLTRYVTLLEHTQDSYILHGDAYFDKIESWIDDLDLGNQMPRSSTMVKQQLTGIVLDSPLLQPYKEQEPFAELFHRLQKIAEEQENDELGKEGLQ